MSIVNAFLAIGYAFLRINLRRLERTLDSYRVILDKQLQVLDRR